MRILQGVDRPDEGSVVLNDAPVRLTGPADAYARGIGMVHQDFMLAPPLTLLENLILAHEPVGRDGLIDWRAARAEADRLARIAGVAIDWRVDGRGRAGSSAANPGNLASSISRRGRSDPR